MSTPKNFSIFTALNAILPVILCCAIDLSYFAIPVSVFFLSAIVAEILLLIVFIKGLICNGQRGRLIRFHYGLILFWVMSFLFEVYQSSINMSDVGSALLGIVSGCCVVRWRGYRLSMLLCILNMGVAFALWYQNGAIAQLELANPIASILIGGIWANLYLVLSHNRLQGFIALLPFAVLFLLILNVGWTLVQFALLPLDRALNLVAVSVYFIVHLIIALLIAWSVWYKRKLDPFWLSALLILAMSLPVYASLMLSA